jgi:DDE superfamily endonuclease
MTRQKASSKKLPETISKVVNRVIQPIKLFFQDESRFGRISQAIACWSPKGKRPIVPSQIIREYTYAYTAICPQDGENVSLILPSMATPCLNLHLAELSKRYPNNHIVLVWDGAGSHRSDTLEIPDNMTLIQLPPYSPELNPVENFWKVLKATGFYNRTFHSLTEVEDLLENRLKQFGDNPQTVQSIVAYDWIISALN